MSARGRLIGALLVSAAAHACLLGALLGTRPAPLQTGVISVRLVELSVERRAAPNVPGGGAVSRPLRREVPVRALDRLLHTGERPAPLVDADRTAPAPGPGSSPAEGQPEVAGRPGAGTVPGGEAARGGTAGPSDWLVGELHRRLAEAAARCYPAAARRLRLHGEVPVRFCLDARGGASGLSLVGSTGSAVLDRSALECVVPGAEPLPAVAGCFQVAVRFGG